MIRRLIILLLIVGCENSTESKDVHFTCMYNIYNFTGAGFESSQSDTLLIHSPSLNEAQSDFCSIRGLMQFQQREIKNNILI